ncbi:sporulation integral membrane protein YlbJ [Paradesulfitobacterium ferrireducens]|uniref:sporulation integral membrane protein YlbJ n=1 Tax=Paradesulfitobacterium ferrireducens TaxID=2816476 RepID=UPI001A8E1BF2|nr:sporulation integral membrane protein YlbJ [Paradesulfitobacterium ferrireducens]
MSAVRVLVLFFLALAMFYYPQEVVTAAIAGLSLWWRFVLPALFPFFILSELLMGQGFVHFLGVLLEPLMRPLFRLPGKASFVLAMAHTSGIPIGAILTARLRQRGEITREEGERLLAFTSNPSPGFMLGAVAAGMLGQPVLGGVLAGSVYIANLLVGLIFRFYRPKPNPASQWQKVSLRRAWQEMKKAQEDDARPFGQILGDAISQSGKTILAVGGFIVFFSVIIHLLSVWHVTDILSIILEPVLGRFLPIAGVKALLEGLLEITIGCRSTISAFSSLNQQVAALAFVMGWGGLSAFFQVMSFTSLTDLRFSAFVLGRTLQGTFAVIFSQLFLRLVDIPAQTAIPVSFTVKDYWIMSWYSLEWFIFILAGMIILSFLFRGRRRV